MKNGDPIVVKVTRYISYSDVVVPQVTPKTPAWLTGTYLGGRSDYDINNERGLITPEISEEEMGELGWDGDYGLVRSSGDIWEIIPEEDWPDEVCVALAKRALLNEDTESE